MFRIIGSRAMAATVMILIITASSFLSPSPSLDFPLLLAVDAKPVLTTEGRLLTSLSDAASWESEADVISVLQQLEGKGRREQEEREAAEAAASAAQDSDTRSTNSNSDSDSSPDSDSPTELETSTTVGDTVAKTAATAADSTEPPKPQSPAQKIRTSFHQLNLASELIRRKSPGEYRSQLHEYTEEEQWCITRFLNGGANVDRTELECRVLLLRLVYQNSIPYYNYSPDDCDFWTSWAFPDRHFTRRINFGHYAAFRTMQSFRPDLAFLPPDESTKYTTSVIYIGGHVEALDGQFIARKYAGKYGLVDPQTLQPLPDPLRDGVLEEVGAGVRNRSSNEDVASSNARESDAAPAGSDRTWKNFIRKVLFRKLVVESKNGGVQVEANSVASKCGAAQVDARGDARALTAENALAEKLNKFLSLALDDEILLRDLTAALLRQEQDKKDESNDMDGDAKSDGNSNGKNGNSNGSSRSAGIINVSSVKESPSDDSNPFWTTNILSNPNVTPEIRHRESMLFAKESQLTAAMGTAMRDSNFNSNFDKFDSANSSNDFNFTLDDLTSTSATCSEEGQVHFHLLEPSTQFMNTLVREMQEVDVDIERKQINDRNQRIRESWKLRRRLFGASRSDNTNGSDSQDSSDSSGSTGTSTPASKYQSIPRTSFSYHAYGVAKESQLVTLAHYGDGSSAEAETRLSHLDEDRKETILIKSTGAMLSDIERTVEEKDGNDDGANADDDGGVGGMCEVVCFVGVSQCQTSCPGYGAATSRGKTADKSSLQPYEMVAKGMTLGPAKGEVDGAEELDNPEEEQVPSVKSEHSAQFESEIIQQDKIPHKCLLHEEASRYVLNTAVDRIMGEWIQKLKDKNVEGLDFDFPEGGNGGSCEGRISGQTERATEKIIPAKTASQPGADGTSPPPKIEQKLYELLHMNCEGCEYEVIPQLADTGQLQNIPHLNIATHMLDALEGEGLERMQNRLVRSTIGYCEMQRKMWDTHYFVQGLPWIWERWTRRCNWRFYGCHGGSDTFVRQQIGTTTSSAYSMRFSSRTKRFKKWDLVTECAMQLCRSEEEFVGFGFRFESNLGGSGGDEGTTLNDPWRRGKLKPGERKERSGATVGEFTCYGIKRIEDTARGVDNADGRVNTGGRVNANGDYEELQAHSGGMLHFKDTVDKNRTHRRSDSSVKKIADKPKSSIEVCQGRTPDTGANDTGALRAGDSNSHNPAPSDGLSAENINPQILSDSGNINPTVVPLVLEGRVSATASRMTVLVCGPDGREVDGLVRRLRASLTDEIAVLGDSGNGSGSTSGTSTAKLNSDRTQNSNNDADSNTKAADSGNSDFPRHHYVLQTSPDPYSHESALSLPVSHSDSTLPAARRHRASYSSTFSGSLDSEIPRQQRSASAPASPNVVRTWQRSLRSHQQVPPFYI